MGAVHDIAFKQTRLSAGCLSLVVKRRVQKRAARNFYLKSIAVVSCVQGVTHKCHIQVTFVHWA